jgi:hypothetical protein
MRYRIVINPLLDCTLVTVTKTEEWRGRVTHETRLYTIEGFFDSHGDLAEFLGVLQRTIGESTP